jgi:hypothetical protein
MRPRPSFSSAREKVAKTHQGVHAEFNRLAKGETRIDRELWRFLPRAYNLKAVADYELGPESVVPLERAAAAIESAGRFVESIAELCSTGANSASVIVVVNSAAVDCDRIHVITAGDGVDSYVSDNTLVGVGDVHSKLGGSRTGPRGGMAMSTPSSFSKRRRIASARFSFDDVSSASAARKMSRASSSIE